jgi:hypothetical protein
MLNAKHIKKLYLGVVLLIAKRSGTSTTHPNQLRLYGGKAKVIKNPDKTGARKKNNIFNILVFNTFVAP